MADTVPVRGLCAVKDIERLLRQQNKAGDFKYSSTTKPTLQEVCDEIDVAYDELALHLIKGGIEIPIYEPLIKNYAILLNALLAAANIENETHTSVKPATTAWGEKLMLLYEKKRDWFLKEAELPTSSVVTINGVPTSVTNTNGNRPTTNLHDIMYSTMAELYDGNSYDTQPRQAFFRVDKEY